MAEGMLRAMLEAHWGADACQIISAGTAAAEGDPAAEHAVTVLGEMGIDLSNHQARMLNEVLITQADLILAMTEGHRDTILTMVAEADGKVQVLNMADPYGMSLEVYRDCAGQLKKQLEELISEIVKEADCQGRKKIAGEE
jgi:protein-tyrosine-phosphatase